MIKLRVKFDKKLGRYYIYRKGGERIGGTALGFDSRKEARSAVKAIRNLSQLGYVKTDDFIKAVYEVFISDEK